jgi:phosphoribosylformimino-5-aminoimidazole carboxamide ribotide isomerase
MQIVPVLDVMSGNVVRAIGGRRSEYRPLVSTLTASTEPLAVADAIRTRHGLSEFYLADLDAIEGAAPALDTFDRLRAIGLQLWVDAGVRDARDAERITEHVDSIVVGLETVRGPEVLAEICKFLRPSPPASEGEGMGMRGVGPNPSPDPSSKRGREKDSSPIFSLDLRDGQPLADCTAWGTTDPLLIAERAIAAGIRRMIVLDLARVGRTDGPGTEDLVHALIHRFTGIDVFVGGGVRDRDDLERLESIGVAGVLVASALHDSDRLF